MKKYILGLILALVAFASHAQLTSNSYTNNTIRMKTSLTSAVDSVVNTNTGTVYLYVPFTVKEAKGVQVLITKTSGTLAGTMTLYGSTDGVSYVALTDATSTPTITTYTVTDTGTYAAPQSTVWNLGFHKFNIYRIGWVGSGTMVGRFKAVVYY